MTKHFYIFRHGQTDWNKEDRVQAQIDNPLNHTGKAQAKALIPLLRDKKLELMISSTMLRARQTAEIANSELNLPVIYDKRLIEIGCGEMEGKTFTELADRYGYESMDRLFNTPYCDSFDLRTVGGEPKPEALRRSIEALTDIALARAENNFAVSCHGLIITLLADYAGADRIYPYNNGDLIHLCYTNKTDSRENGRWKMKNYIFNSASLLEMQL